MVFSSKFPIKFDSQMDASTFPHNKGVLIYASEANQGSCINNLFGRAKMMEEVRYLDSLFFFFLTILIIWNRLIYASGIQAKGIRKTFSISFHTNDLEDRK